MIVLGITGGSGAGKTTAADTLKKEGAYIIDCDKISREITEKDTRAYDEIVSFFGKDILTELGEINRKALGSIVFNDREKLKKLEEITHAAIIAETKNRLKAAKAENKPLVVIDAPLLTETGLNRLCDKIWLFDADYNTRLSRIAKRDGLSLEAAKSRLRSQTAIDALKPFADEIIDTTALSLEEAETKIKTLKEHLYA